jgi:hypothetical protein
LVEHLCEIKKTIQMTFEAMTKFCK